jgi:hypothetical protein
VGPQVQPGGPLKEASEKSRVWKIRRIKAGRDEEKKGRTQVGKNWQTFYCKQPFL